MKIEKIIENALKNAKIDSKQTLQILMELVELAHKNGLDEQMVEAFEKHGVKLDIEVEE